MIVGVKGTALKEGRGSTPADAAQCSDDLLDHAVGEIFLLGVNNWTDKYPAIAKAIAGLPAQNAYLDGDFAGCCPTAGRPSTLSRTRPILARDRWSS
jgi:hypothetical protein